MIHFKSLKQKVLVNMSYFLRLISLLRVSRLSLNESVFFQQLVLGLKHKLTRFDVAEFIYCQQKRIR